MAKIRKDLVGSVLVTLPGQSDPVVLVAGDTVPDGVEFGEHVLAKKESKSESGKPSKPAKSEKAPKSTPAPAAADSAADGTTGATGAGSLTVPPIVGAGSSTDAWRAYAVAATAAAGLQLDIADDAKRGDIIEALKSAGIATE